MDIFDLADIYDNLQKDEPILPGATGGAWEDRDPLITELKSRSMARRKAVMENPKAKLHHILVGLKDKHEQVAAAAARSPLLDPEHLRLVMQSTSALVRREALNNPKLPVDMIDRALNSPDISFRDLVNLSQNPALQHPQLKKMLAVARPLGSGYESLLNTALSHPGYDKKAIDAEAKEALESGDTDYLYAAAQSPALSPKMIAAIIRRGPIQTNDEYSTIADNHLYPLTNNPNLTGDHILQALKNNNLPVRLLRGMVDPDDDHIKTLLDPRHIAFLYNPKDHRQASRNQDICNYHAEDLIENKKLWPPENVSLALANPHNDNDEMNNVLKRHATPEQAQEVLAHYAGPNSPLRTDPNERGRVIGAGTRLLDEEHNMGTTPEQRQIAVDTLHGANVILGKDTDDTLCRLVSNSDMVRPEHLDHIVRNREPRTYGGFDEAFQHPKLPQETINWVATHADSTYRLMAAMGKANERLPPEIRSKLLRDPIEGVRSKVMYERPGLLSPQDWEFAMEPGSPITPHMIERCFRNDNGYPIPEAYQMVLNRGGPLAKSVASSGGLPSHIAHAVLDGETVDLEVRKNILTNSEVNLRPQDLEYMINSGNTELHYHAAKSPHITIEQLRHMSSQDAIMSNSDVAEKVKRGITLRDPDGAYKKVHVRFNTGKLRKIRDHILENGKEDMKQNDIQKKVPLPGNMDWNAMRNPNGNISAKKIQAYIDALPATTYNISARMWRGAQMYSKALPQNVFQLNMTNDHVRQLKEAGLSDYWKKISGEYIGSHPSHEHTLGWVRHSGEPGEGIFMDEVQSDYINSPQMKATSRAKRDFLQDEQSNRAQYGDQFETKLNEHIKKAYDRATVEYGPEEQHDRMVKILFGDKHSNELLHEAFAQHLRDNGHAGTKIAIHSTHTKAKMNGWEGGEIPVHGKIAYEQHPKKMGFEPGTFHESNMPAMVADSNVEQGAPIWQDKLRKYEKLKDLIKQMILTKMEKHDASED